MPRFNSHKLKKIYLTFGLASDLPKKNPQTVNQKASANDGGDDEVARRS